MITNFQQIQDSLKNKMPIPIAIVQPKHKSLQESVTKAEKNGWIIPYYFENKNKSIAAKMAVNSVLDGTCSLLMKGDIKTSILLKSVLANSKNSKKNRLSHIAVMETPKYDRLMLWTDGGVNVNLNKTIITSIIHNALKITKELKIHHPNIAMLALVEKRVSQLPETVLADEICKCFSNDLSITVEGPISLDVALSKYAANQKRIKSLIAGKTDVFVGPSITTINLIVKALLGLGQAKVGGIVLGWRVPIVLLSRSDDSTTRLNSIALGAFLTKRK